MKTVLYRTARGEVDLYRINPDTKVSFDNERDGEKNVGFRARTVNRDNEFRSFRYDRMIRQGLPVQKTLEDLDLEAKKRPYTPPVGLPPLPQ